MAQYYFANTGSDSNGNGSQASPWRTINKANTVALAGDTINLKGGDKFRETIKPSNSGTSGNPIIFQSYGTGKALITGLDALTNNWQVHDATKNIYKLALTSSWNRGIGKNQVFINGQALIEARWPKISNPLDVKRNTCAISTVGEVDLNSGINGIYTAYYEHSDLANFANGSLVNAYMAFSPGMEWLGYSSQVIGHSGNQITFRYPYTSGDQVNKVSADDPFYLFGSYTFLTQAGEWFFDINGTIGAAYTLYMIPPAGANFATAEMKMRNACIDFRNRSYITAQNLDCLAGYCDSSDSNVAAIFQDLSIKHARCNQYSTFGLREPAIYLKGANSKVINCDIDGCSGGGIEYSGGADQEIKNNTISNVLYGLPVQGAGITANGNLVSNTSIENNTIYNTARSGINPGIGSKVRYNRVFNIGTLLTDVAGISAYNVGDANGADITCNLVYNGVGYKNSVGSHNGCSGIRLDNGGGQGCINWSIVGNIIYNVNSPCIPIWPLASNQGGYGDMKLKVLNNSMDGDIVFISPANTSDSYSGAIVENNLCHVYSNGNDTRYYTNIPTGVTFTNNLVETLSIANNLSGLPGVSNPLERDFKLNSNSSAVGGGVALTPHTDNYGNPPDIGAIKYGTTCFVAGAIAPSSCLSSLTVEKDTLCSKRLIIRQLPKGRVLPSTFKLRLGANGDILEVYSIVTDVESVAYAIVPGTATGSTRIYLSYDGTNFVDTGTDIDLTPPSSQGSTYSYTKVPIVTSMGMRDLRYRPSLVRIDTASLVSQGKLGTDGSGMKFVVNGTEELNYWIEEGTFNTNNTLIWIAKSSLAIETLNWQPVDLCFHYGNSNWANSSNRSLVFPSLVRPSMKLWLKAHEHYALGNSSVSSLTDYSGNSTTVQIVNSLIATAIDSSNLMSLSFDGVNDYLTTAFSGSNPITVLLVYSNPSPGSANWQRLCSSGGTGVLDYQGGAYNTPIQNASGVPTPQSVPVIVATNNSAKDLSNFNIGRNKDSGGFFKGNLFELMLFFESLNVIARAPWEYYVKCKYLIPTTCASLTFDWNNQIDVYV